MGDEIAEIEYTDPFFQLHEFSCVIFDTDVKFEIMKMKDSTFIWIGDNNNPLLSNLSFGIKSPYASNSLTTMILGTASTDSTSLMMAERLNQKLKKPIYVSFNVSVMNRNMLEEIEKRLKEEMELNRDVF